MVVPPALQEVIIERGHGIFFPCDEVIPAVGPQDAERVIDMFRREAGIESRELVLGIGRRAVWQGTGIKNEVSVMPALLNKENYITENNNTLKLTEKYKNFRLIDNRIK